jgi:hypothetical protein
MFFGVVSRATPAMLANGMLRGPPSSQKLPFTSLIHCYKETRTQHRQKIPSVAMIFAGVVYESLCNKGLKK